jgi:hypothetical protein
MRRHRRSIVSRRRVICQIDGADVSDRCLEASEETACWGRR